MASKLSSWGRRPAPTQRRPRIGRLPCEGTHVKVICTCNVASWVKEAFVLSTRPSKKQKRQSLRSTTFRADWESSAKTTLPVHPASRTAPTSLAAQSNVRCQVQRSRILSKLQSQRLRQGVTEVTRIDRRRSRRLFRHSLKQESFLTSVSRRSQGSTQMLSALTAPQQMHQRWLSTAA